MAELFNTRCTQGKLIITETAIIIELGQGGRLRQQTMLRASLTDVASSMGVVSVFGKGGGTNLAFKSQSGEVLKAGLVNPAIAKEIVKMLQGR